MYFGTTAVVAIPMVAMSPHTAHIKQSNICSYYFHGHACMDNYMHYTGTLSWYRQNLTQTEGQVSLVNRILSLGWCLSIGDY